MLQISLILNPQKKVRASMVILQLQKAFTDLLERYGKKKKNIQDEETKGFNIRIIEPESLRKMKEGKSEKEDNKGDHKKEK